MLNISEDSLFFIVLMSSTLLLMLLGFFFAFIQLYRRRQLLFETAQKEREQEFSKELFRSQLEIREKVMHQISEELHDNIGQTLIVAKMQLGMIDRDQFPEQIDAANELLSRSLQDLRSISKILSGDYIIREGLNSALAHEVKLINSSRQLNCSIAGSLPGNCFIPNVEVIVFRCVQEILSNAIKHSRADKIKICITDHNKRILIEISDNGKGIPMDDKQNEGLGMNNLHRRVELIDGKLKIQSENDKGTRISLYIPKNQHDKVQS